MQGDAPPARVYNSAALCQTGSAMGMMVIFGGRTQDQRTLNDTWGLRRHRDGRWDWVRAPYNKQQGITPTGRYQHATLFLGSTMLVIGGRTNQVGEIVNLEVYDTETSEWFKFPCVQRFRQASWYVDNNIFIHGGFDHEMPNIPTGTLFKIDTNQLFAKHKNLGAKDKIEPSVKGKDPPPRLASTVIVYMGNEMGGLQDEFGELVRRVSIDKLQEESKRLGVAPMMSTAQKANQVEKLADHFLQFLLKPNEWKSEIQKLPFTSNQVEQLIDEVLKLLQKETSLIRIRSPVKIFGDLHGQYQDLMRFFELWGAPNEIPGEGDIESFDYLFLGDYIGRGSNYCLELILTLFALKIKYPEQIHLLRGHYDDKKYVSSIFDECLSKFPNQNVEDPNSVAFRIYATFD